MSSSRTLGIVVGRGDLPSIVANFCKEKKRPYCLFPIESQVDRAFVDQHPHVWISPGQIKKNLGLFRHYQITDLVFVGHVTRPSFFSIKFDLMGLKWLATIGWKAKGDDGLLSGVVDLLEAEGFHVIGVHQFIKELLMPAGVLGKISPSDEEKKSILIGFLAAKELGLKDIGQGVIMENGDVIAKEDRQGTDWMIKNTAQNLKKNGGALLVKVAKPQQETRVDLPTIGPDTIENLAGYGYRGVALEAGAGLILHQEKVIELANKKGIFIYGVSATEI